MRPHPLPIGDAATPSVRDRLVGTWELVRYSMTASDEEVYYPLGPDATGLIMYTTDGYMSAQLMSASRAQFASPGVHSGTQDEIVAAARGYLAYSGQYQIENDGHTVRHRVRASLFPNWIDTDRTRHITRLNDNDLTLTSAPQRTSGKTWNAAVVWRRAGVVAS
ncbi:lipocalin-like domain-containing protein [Tsukamurella sp. NPDC003166]|uniref:lipocalin-like domain-containing protein n=1 Tax=Tsukamurella sp. NPDC003166 TaxID=3154444 RepID=UPI0033B68401